MYKELLTASLQKWLNGIIKDLLPGVQNPPVLMQINSIMGTLFGVDLRKYNILQEFSFLIPNLLEGRIKSIVDDFLEKVKIPDDSIPERVGWFMDSCIQECRKKGSLNVFGLQFNEKSFQNFKKIYEAAIDEAGYKTYTSRGSDD